MEIQKENKHMILAKAPIPFLLLSFFAAVTAIANGQAVPVGPTGRTTQDIANQSANQNRGANQMGNLPGTRSPNKTVADIAKENAFRKKILGAMAEQEIKVGKVIDGDTFESVVGGKNVPLRVVGIDAPEEGQENWQQSKDRLAEMISGKTVTIRYSNFYTWHAGGFFIVHVISDKIDIGSYMLSNGWAWYDKSFSVFFTEKEDEENNKAMKKAKSEKLGIWQSGKAKEPWEFTEKTKKKKDKAAKN